MITIFCPNDGVAISDWEACILDLASAAILTPGPVANRPTMPRDALGRTSREHKREILTDR